LLRFRLGPNDGVTVCVQAKEPGDRLVSHPVELDVNFEQVFGARQQPYQRLLGDALDGNLAASLAVISALQADCGVKVWKPRRAQIPVIGAATDARSCMTAYSTQVVTSSRPWSGAAPGMNSPSARRWGGRPVALAKVRRWTPRYFDLQRDAA
jgi:hypothetical protein